MLHKQISIAAAVVLALSATAADAGITVYKDDTKFVKMGGRIQLQYHRENPETGTTTDELFFRRLRPYIQAGINKDWSGKVEWEMGNADGTNELSVQSAYARYSGIDGLKIDIGNATFPFSREVVVSSGKQQTVERTFVGDHNYGVPDKVAGIHVNGKALGSKLIYGAAFTSASVDPDQTKLDVDTPINRNADFNQGWLAGGRIEFQPIGKVDFSQADFSRELGLAFGIGAYVWDNDGDNNTSTDAAGNHTGGTNPDVDRITGIELSVSLRGYGLSVDFQANRFNAETVDGAYTGGLFQTGDAELTQFALEGGYMILPKTLEVVAAHESQDSDTYADPWVRDTLGVNYYLQGHDLKLQLNLRKSENIDGVAGADSVESFLQGQYQF